MGEFCHTAIPVPSLIFLDCDIHALKKTTDYFRIVQILKKTQQVLTLHFRFTELTPHVYAGLVQEKNLCHFLKQSESFTLISALVKYCQGW